jgi:tetratricopeptide (TPR) repeat protein
MRDLSAALWVVGEHERADSVLEQVLEHAVREKDRRIEWYGRLERAGRRDTRAEAPAEELETVARDAIRVFDELQDDLGLARAWRRIAYAAERRCSFAAAAEASERALVHVKRVGAAQDEARVVDRLCMALLYGPMHVTEAMRRCDEILRDARPNLLTEANVLSAVSGLRAMDGRFDEARAAYHRAREIYDELGLRLLAGSLTVISGPVELAIGNAAAAEAELRLGVEIAREIGSSRGLGEDAALLAVALLAQGKRDEAAAFLEISRHSASSADVAAQVLWRAAQARLDGDDRLARDAVALADETDALSLQGDARASLAEVLEASGASDEAVAERERARELYSKKGNVAAASRLATARVLRSR